MASKNFNFFTGMALSGLILVNVLPGCQGAVDLPEKDDAPSTPAPFEPSLSLTPSVAALGEELTLTLSTVGLLFDDETLVDLGDDILLIDQERLDEKTLFLDVLIDPDALPGPRPLTVTTRSGDQTLDDALLLQTGAFTLQPASLARGETGDLEVEVEGIELIEGYTWMSFGDGVTTLSFTPIEAQKASVRVRVDSDALVGTRTPEIQNGDQRVILPDGFSVDRGLIAITFEPPEMTQGETVTYRIEGYGTHFEEGKTSINLGGGVIIDVNADPANMVIESPTLITGTLEVCESAVPGLHDVTVTTIMDDGPDEVLTDSDALTVYEIPVTIAQAAGYFSLTYNHAIRDGEVKHTISAYGQFRARTASCSLTADPEESEGSSGSDCTASPQPYDDPVFYPPEGCDTSSEDSSSSSNSGSSTYAPAPYFDAGPHIYFEIPGGPSIQLDRYEDLDGTLYYTNEYTIPLEDYWFDAAYNIRTEGSEDPEGIPAFVAEEVLLTLPTDFSLDAPDLFYTPTLDRYDSIDMQWSDPEGNPGADTLLIGAMYSSVRTTDAETGDPSEIRVIPFDDGDYSYPADLVSQLYPGSGRLLLQTVRAGPTFYTPESSHTSAAYSSVSWNGRFELR